MSSPPGQASFDATRRARGHRREPALRQGRFLTIFLVATRRWSPAGARPANHRQPTAPHKHDKGSRAWTPAFAGRRIVPECRARTGDTDDNLPAMAKPSRQWPSPSAAPSAARGRCRVARSMSEPVRASFDATRRTFVLYPSFLSPQRKMVAQGETRPITANRRHPKIEAARIKTLDPGLRRATNRVPDAAPRQRQRAAGNGEAETAAAFLLLRRRAQPAAGGIVASMSEPPGASFRRDRRTRVERGGKAGAAGRGILCLLSLSPRSPAGARPGQSPPTEGTPKPNDKDQEPWTPAFAGATKIVPECRAPSEGTTPAGNGCRRHILHAPESRLKGVSPEMRAPHGSKHGG